MEAVNWTQWGGLLVDLVIISIFISHIFWGYRRGLVNIMFSVLSFIVALIIMFVLYKPVANMIMTKTQLDEKLTASIEANLSGTTLADGELIKAEQSNMSSSLVEKINEYATTAINDGKANVISYISVRIARMMIYTGTMLLLFIIARLLLFIVRFVAELIANLPFIRTINKSGGLVFGLIKGVLVIYLILALMSIASPITSELGITAAISKSHIGSILYNHNLLLNMLYNNLKNFID